MGSYASRSWRRLLIVTDIPHNPNHGRPEDIRHGFTFHRAKKTWLGDEAMGRDDGAKRWGQGALLEAYSISTYVSA